MRAKGASTYTSDCFWSLFYKTAFNGYIFHILDSILLAKSLQSSGNIWNVLSKRKGSAFPEEDPYAKWKPSADTADYYKFGIFMDFDCDSSKEIFNEVNILFIIRTFIHTRVQYLSAAQNFISS